MSNTPRVFARAAAITLLLVAGTAAAGAPLTGPALQTVVAGAVFRGFTDTLRGFENHIWRFSPDGRVTTVFSIRKDTPRNGYHFEGSASGTWSVQGDRLCIRWEPGFYTDSDCYRLVIDESVSVTDGHFVRLIGREGWQGTLQR